MLAATLITYTGRAGSRSGRRNVISSLPGRSGPGRLGRPAARELAIGRLSLAVGDGRDLDLAWLGLLGLRDAEREHAVLEGGRGLIRLEALGQGHRPAEGAAPDLLDQIAALVAGALLGGLAADRQRPVLDGDVDVVRLDARKRRLDGERVRVGGHVERKGWCGEGTTRPIEWTEVVIEESVHRLAERHDVAEARWTANDRHLAYLLDLPAVRRARSRSP